MAKDINYVELIQKVVDKRMNELLDKMSLKELIKQTLYELIFEQIERPVNKSNTITEAKKPSNTVSKFKEQLEKEILGNAGKTAEIFGKKELKQNMEQYEFTSNESSTPVSLNNLPEHLQKAFTKNYSDEVK